MENWVDQNNDGNWVKVFEPVDAGGWGHEGIGCGGQADQIITWGGPIATFRWDSATDVDFKNLSIREINAQGGPAASGTVAGAFTSGGDGEQLMTTEQEEKEEAIDRNQKIATSGDYVYVV